MITYGNPCMRAEIADWPMGESRRGTATFYVETHPTRGQRGARFTIDPKTGKSSATKLLTYASKVRIVDGDDGRTYLVEWSSLYGFVTVMRGDMKIQEETIWPKDGQRFRDTMKLFDE